MGLRRVALAVVGVLLIAAGCSPVVPEDAPPGAQRVRIVVDGRRAWDGEGDVPAGSFRLTRLADGRVGTLAGAAEVVSSAGDRLDVAVDVTRVLDGAVGSVTVRNLSSGKQVDALVAGTVPTVTPGPDGSWQVTMTASWGSFYRGEWFAGSVTFELEVDDVVDEPGDELSGTSPAEPIDVTVGDEVTVQLEVPIAFHNPAGVTVTGAGASVTAASAGTVGGRSLVNLSVDATHAPVGETSFEVTVETCATATCDAATGLWRFPVTLTVSPAVDAGASLDSFVSAVDEFLVEFNAATGASALRPSADPVPPGAGDVRGAEAAVAPLPVVDPDGTTVLGSMAARRDTRSSAGVASASVASAGVAPECSQWVGQDTLGARFDDAYALSEAQRRGMTVSFFTDYPGIEPALPPLQELGYGAGIWYFVDWMGRSGRLDADARWWRATDGMMMLDMESARALHESCGESASSNLPGVAAWLEYIDAPSQRSLWDAHQASLHFAIDLLPAPFQGFPSSREALFASMVVQNVDYTALRNQADSGDGWSRDYQATGMAAFLQVFYPATFPAQQGHLELHVELGFTDLDIPFPPGKGHLGVLGLLDETVRKLAVDLSDDALSRCPSAVPVCEVARAAVPKVRALLLQLDPLRAWLHPSWPDWQAREQLGQLGFGSSGWYPEPWCGIERAACEFVILTETLPNPVVGQPYSVQLEANQAATWTIRQGALAPGLELSTSGLLAGTPTGVGTTTVVVRATNEENRIAEVTYSFDNGGAVDDPIVAFDEPSNGVGCAVHESATVKCWGYFRDQNRRPIGWGWPLEIPALRGATQVDTGSGYRDHRICGLVSGRVRCVTNSVTVDASIDPSEAPYVVVESFAGEAVDLPGVEGATQLDSKCARLATGKVACWGSNRRGELGQGGDNYGFEYGEPAVVKGLPSATAVAVGGEHACALAETGAVWCWGDNNRGNLGDGTAVEFSTTPVRVVGLDDATAITAGSSHTCALRRTGSVVCWGDNAAFQLGFGKSIDGVGPDPQMSNVPVEARGPFGSVRSVKAGGLRSCVVQASGAAACWGGFGYAGHGNLGGFLRIGFRDGRRVVVYADGQGGEVEVDPDCCLYNTTGGAVAHATSLALPVHAWVTNQGYRAFSGAVGIELGTRHSCVLNGSGELYCWGIASGPHYGNGGGFPNWGLTNTTTQTPTLPVGTVQRCPSDSPGDEGGYYIGNICFR